MVKIHDLNEDFADLIYTDQTGCFPTRSSQGNQYIMVLAGIDSNSILVERMKNRTAGEMVKVYQCPIDRLKDCGLTFMHHNLDNEWSAEFKQAIKANNMTYELTPADDHSRNIAEKTIQTFNKDHFIAILCGTDDVYPMHLWEKLLPQADMTLNMLRPSRLISAISAHAHLYDQHNYADHPLAPMGRAAETNVSSNKRGTWVAHSVSGFNVGTSTNRTDATKFGSRTQKYYDSANSALQAHILNYAHAHLGQIIWK